LFVKGEEEDCEQKKSLIRKEETANRGEGDKKLFY